MLILFILGLVLIIIGYIKLNQVDKIIYRYMPRSLYDSQFFYEKNEDLYTLYDNNL